MQDRNASAYQSVRPTQPRPKPRAATQAEIRARMDHNAGLRGTTASGRMQGNGSGGISPWNPDYENFGQPNGLDELAMGPAILPDGGFDSSGGGRRYGGGGGGGGAAQKAALQAAYNDLLTQGGSLYDSYGETLKGLYDPNKVDDIYKSATRGVKTATKTGRDRVNKIYNDQMARNAQARTAIQGAFSQGQQNLQGIQSGFMANNAATNDRLNNSLGAFGAGELQDGNGDRLSQLFASGQIFNNNLATTFDAAQADRGAIYGAQAQDVLTGMSAEEASMMRQLVAQRTRDRRQNDATLAQAQMQNSLGKLNSEQEIRLALAQMGMTPTNVDPATGIPTNLTPAQQEYLRSVDPARKQG